MRWSNFTYVLRQEGWKSAIKVAIWGWVKIPWLRVRVKIADAVLSVLKVKDKFD